MSQILTQITQQYQQATNGWETYLFPVAQHLFAVLATIEIAWSGILWAIHKPEVESMWIEFLKKMITLGFFYTILIEAQTWMPDVIQSFIKIGAGASHISGLYPSDILDQGISVAESIMEPLLKAGLLHAGVGILVGGIAALVIIISFALIAAELIVTLIESYIVVSAGILLLGFAASQFTTGYASKYLNYAMSVGVKLFMLYLIIGVGSTLAANWGQLVIAGGMKNMTPFFEVIGGALVFLYIAKTIPAKAEALLSGTVNSPGAGLTAVATGATMTAVNTVINTAQAGMEGLKQAAMVSKQNDYSAFGLAKGIGTAAKNLLVSAVGSHSGHSRNTGTSMEQQTRKLGRSIAEKMESDTAKGKRS